MTTPVYLDCNATAPVRPEAREAMAHALHFEKVAAIVGIQG